MPLVLNTGVYPPLLETRRLILEHAGHVVVTKAAESEIATACEVHQFDVAVIGQSASPQLKRRLFNVIRRHCRTVKVLELTSPDSSKTLDAADAWLEVRPMETDALAQRVNELANS